MRRIGTLSDQTLAQRFCDYLVTLAIDAVADPAGDDQDAEWSVWIRDEKYVDQARLEFKQFEQSPDEPRYLVESKAAEIRDQKIADEQRRLKNQRELAKSLPPSGGGFGAMSGAPVRQQAIPATIGFIVIAVVVGFATNFGYLGNANPNKLTIAQKTYLGLSFVDRRDYNENEDSFASIRKGEIWRVVTPMFLHGDEFHIAFNMLMLFFFGSAIERLHGSVFLALLVIGTHIAAMMVQVSLPDADFMPEALRGSPFAVGASGAVYGLFGFLWIRPSLDPSYPIHLVPMNVAIMLGWLVLCMTPLVDRVANGAHLGGLMAGMLAALIATRLTDE